MIVNKNWIFCSETSRKTTKLSFKFFQLKMNCWRPSLTKHPKTIKRSQKASRSQSLRTNLTSSLSTRRSNGLTRWFKSQTFTANCLWRWTCIESWRRLTFGCSTTKDLNLRRAKYMAPRSFRTSKWSQNVLLTSFSWKYSNLVHQTTNLAKI